MYLERNFILLREVRGMDRTTMIAYQKLQKREHSLKWLRSQLRYGRITEEVFREKEAQVLRKYRLTPRRSGYHLHMQMVRQRQRKRNRLSEGVAAPSPQFNIDGFKNKLPVNCGRRLWGYGQTFHRHEGEWSKVRIYRELSDQEFEEMLNLIGGEFSRILGVAL